MPAVLSFWKRKHLQNSSKNNTDLLKSLQVLADCQAVIDGIRLHTPLLHCLPVTFINKPHHTYNNSITKIRAMADQEHQYKFNVSMSCGGCSGAVERVLKKLDGNYPSALLPLLFNKSR